MVRTSEREDEPITPIIDLERKWTRSEKQGTRNKNIKHQTSNNVMCDEDTACIELGVAEDQEKHGEVGSSSQCEGRWPPPGRWDNSHVGQPKSA
jgi:hypothetical protein